MTTNGGTSFHFTTSGSCSYTTSCSYSYTTTTTPRAAFGSSVYYKSFDFGREMIMTKVTERHKENEGIDLIIENPSQGLDDLLVMQR